MPPTRWPTRAEAAASLTFSPVRVGAFTSRTRTWVPAMVPWRSNDQGFVTPDVLDWYGRFADGRPGVLVVEATGIRDVPSGPLLRIGDERFVPGLRDLAAVVRERSSGATRLVIQIIDFLALRRRPAKEAYLSRYLKITDAHRERLTRLASARAGGATDAAVNFDAALSLDAAVSMDAALSLDDEGVRRALLTLSDADLAQVLDEREREDLERGSRERVTDVHLPHVRDLPRVLPDLFASAADRARRAGFDGVELHYAHAYTMASFLSRRNTRADGYGTTRAGRLRLALEVLAAVRARVGHDYTVGCRMLGDEAIEGGSDLDDACHFARELALAGLDFVSVSKGGKFEDAKPPRVGEAIYPYTGPSGHECMPTVKLARERGAPGPFGWNLPLSRAIRDAVRGAGLATPIVGSGALNSFEILEAALARGDCDLVAAARQSLADPDWWRKMEEGRGAAIRRCIYTNYCEALDQRHLQVTCQRWDRDFALEDRGGGIARSHDGKRRLLAPPDVRVEPDLPTEPGSC